MVTSLMSVDRGTLGQCWPKIFAQNGFTSH
jgi:hypothetical protein